MRERVIGGAGFPLGFLASLSRALLLAALAAIASLSACAPQYGAVQPAATEIGRFPTPEGMTGVVLQAPLTYSYDLYFPGSGLLPLRLAKLDGLADVRVVDAMIAGGEESVVLLEGTLPDCLHRYVVVAARSPQVQSLTLPGCGRQFNLVAQRDGRSVAIRQTDARPATYFIYRNSRIFGPSVERAGRAAAPARAARAPAAASGQPSSAGGGASPPMDLDALPAPSGTAPLNLD